MLHPLFFTVLRHVINPIHRSVLFHICFLGLSTPTSHLPYAGLDFSLRRFLYWALCSVSCPRVLATPLRTGIRSLF